MSASMEFPMHQPPGPAGAAPAPWLERLWSWAMALALGALGLFLPYSTAGVSLSSAAVLVLVLMRPRLLWQVAPWRHPVLGVGLALFAYIALHTLWRSGWSSEAGQAVNRYHELIVCPLLFVAMLDERGRRLFCGALAVGLAGLAAAYWLVLVLPNAWPELTSSLSARRISGGFALALGAFLFMAASTHLPRPWVARALAAALAATVLLAMDGRTGQLLLILLSAYAAWQIAPRRMRWALAIAVPVLAIGLAATSSGVKTRVAETLRGEMPHPNGQLTSTAIRLQFVRFAVELAQEHWATGAGYANYPEVHERAARARYTNDPVRSAWLDHAWVRTPNPHNEYAMQLVGGGIAALGLYLAWLALALRAGLRAPAPLRPMLVGTVFAFAVGSLLNSSLMDFIEGHVYMTLLAAMLAAAHRPPPLRT